MKRAIYTWILVISALFIHAQNPSGNYNPFVAQGIITPAPLLPVEMNGTGVASFKTGNTGNDALVWDVAIPNNDMILVITLSRGVPNVTPLNATTALTVLGGPLSVYFNWTYDVVTNSYTGRQNQTIPGLLQGLINIQYKVSQNSLDPGQNGFNVNLTPPPYTNSSNSLNDDQVSCYTWTDYRDFGDAPLTYGSADHVIDYENYLGATFDGELSYQASANATADGADEDGVIFPVLRHGVTVNISYTVTGGGRINAWLDWNGDGDFADTGEQIATNLNRIDGTYSLPVTVPMDAITSAPTFVRFRLGPSGLSYSGPAAYGEVEDYQVTILCEEMVAPAVSLTQPDCTHATGAITVTAPLGSGYTYSIDGINYSNTSGIFSGLAAATYPVTARKSNGCITPVYQAVINAQPVIPTAPLVGDRTQPTCALATGSVFLSGLPSSGSWTLTRTPGAVNTSGTGISTTVSGIPPGTYTFTVTNAAACTSPSSANVVINNQPSSPTAPQQTVDCSGGSGNAVVSVTSPLGAGMEYRLDNGGYQSGTVFSSVVNGNHTLTVKNSDGCTTTGNSFSVSCGCANPPALLLASSSGSTCGILPVTVSGNIFGGSATSVLINSNGAGIVTPSATGVTPFSFTYNPSVADAGNTVVITVITNNPQGAPCVAAQATYTLAVNPVPGAPVPGQPVQPSCSVSTGSVVLSGLPASGTWTLIRNPGSVVTTGSGSSYTVPGLTPGSYTFTVTNAFNCVSPVSAPVVINSQPATPSLPAQNVECGAGGNAVVTVTSPLGSGTEYNLDGGPYQASPVFSSVTSGLHYITVRNSSGCTRQGDNFQVSCGCQNPPLVALTGNSGSTCPDQPKSISGTFSGSATAVTVSENGAGTINPSTASTSPFTFTYTPAPGDAGNTVIITVTTNNPAGNPCQPASASYSLNVYPVPPAPVPGSATLASCENPTGDVELTGLPPAGTWTVIRYPGEVSRTGSGISTIITGLSPGTYTFTVTNSAGCTSAPSSGVTVNSSGNIPKAPVISNLIQTDCFTATGSVTLNGLPASGQWMIARTPGPFQQFGTGTSVTIAGITPGTYTFSVTNQEGCTSVTSDYFTIHPQPSTPSAPVPGLPVQPTCTVSTGSVMLSGLPATGTWTLKRNPGGVTSSGSGQGTIVSALLPGTYSFSVTNEAGCTSPLSPNVVINAQPAVPAVPAHAVDCTLGFGNGKVTVLTPLGIDLQYRLDNGPYQGGTVFSGVANGNHTITVRNSTCETTGTSFPVNCGCVNPPVLQLASAGGSTCGISPVTVSGNLFGGSATGVTITENGAGSVSAVSANSSPFTFTYTPVSEDAGKTVIITVTTNNPLGAPCTAVSGSYTLVVNPQPGVPAPGVPTQPTCSLSTGSVVLAGLPGTGIWMLNRTPDGVSSAGSGTTFTVSGLVPGTYRFTVTASGCTSEPSIPVTILPQPVTPSAPLAGNPVQPTCAAATGSVTLTGLPLTGNWTLIRNPGAVTVTGSGSSRTIEGLPAGSYTFTVTNDQGCTSPASLPVVIMPQPATPSAPVAGLPVQPTCTVATGSVTLTSLPSTGTWTLTRNPGAVLVTGTGVSKTIEGLPAGTYSFTVTNADGCTSKPSSNVVINTQPATPAAPQPGIPVQPTCLISTGSVLLSGLPSPGNWTITKYPGGITINGSGPTTTISGLNAGSWTFMVTNAAGCSSPMSGAVTINGVPSAPAAPVAGIPVQPNCTVSTGSVSLTGLPASGTWILTRNPGAVTISGTGTSKEVKDLPAGTWTFSVTDANGCISPASQPVVINTQPPVPVAPLAGSPVQPTCNTPWGSVMLSGLPSTGNWKITRNPGAVVISGSGSSYNIPNLPAGEFTFTVTNEAGCTSLPSGRVTISAQPGMPQPPLAGDLSQPTCIQPYGSVVLKGLPIPGTYTITRNPGNITYSASGATYLVSSLQPGSYTFTVTTAAGCTSLPSEAVVIRALPQAPPVPVAGVTLHPDCVTPTGSVALSGLPSGTWTITRNPGNVTFTGTVSSTLVSGIPPGIHNITVTDQSGCTSLPVTVIINPQPTEIVVDAGADAVICSTAGKYQLAGSVINGRTMVWTTLGTGTFDDPTRLNPVYTPGAADMSDGQVQLVLNARGYGACPAVSDFMVLTIWQQPTAYSGTDSKICFGSSYRIPDARADHYSKVKWTHNGTGTLTGDNTLTPVYTPGKNDNGTIVLTLTATPEGGQFCSTVTDQMQLQITNDLAIACPGTPLYRFDMSPGICGYVVPDNRLEPVVTGSCSPVTLRHNLAGWANPVSLKGATLPAGRTDIIWTATDAAGNNVQCSYAVEVTDKQPPVFENCPEGQVLTVALFSGFCQGSAIWSNPVARDNCSGVTVIQTSGPVRGSVIAAGTYPVEYTATDAAGNKSFCRFTLKVIDTESPIAVCPGDLVHATDSGRCTWKPGPGTLQLSLVNANCPFETSWTVTGATQGSGTGDVSVITFNKGTSLVSYTVKESVSGQLWNCSFRVIVTDQEKPAPECPLSVTHAVDPGKCSASLTLQAPRFSDNCSSVPALVTYRIFGPDNSISGPFTGTQAVYSFQSGYNRVEWTMTDDAGNSSTCLQQIRITENEMPVLVCPKEKQYEFKVTQGRCGYLVTDKQLDATATDNCGNVILTHNFGGWSNKTSLEGATFLVGVTLVTWEVSDQSGNRQSCAITIKVTDDEPPYFVNCPSGKTFTIGLFSDNCEGGAIWSIPVAMDNCPGVTVKQTAGPAQGSKLTVGQYTIGYTATDAAGNTANCSFGVNVIDTQKPLLVCNEDIVAETDPGVCTWTSKAGSLTPLLATSNCSSVVTWEVTNPNGTKSNGTNDVSGFTFMSGTSNVRYEIKEGSSTQSSVCNFTVTVVDREAPAIICPADLTINAKPGECTADAQLAVPGTSENCTSPVQVTWKVHAPDNSIAGPFTTASLSYRFMAGISQVEWIARDAAGNQASCMQAVKILISTAGLTPDAGPDAIVCEKSSFRLNNARASNYTRLLWSTSGTGKFSDAAVLNPVYVPSASDILNGEVVLTLSAFTTCATASDQLILTITGYPGVSAGPDRSLCNGENIRITGASAKNCASILWTSSGSGSLTGSTTLTPVYKPGSGEYGIIRMIITGKGLGGCGEITVNDTLNINIYRPLQVSAGEDVAILAGRTTLLSSIVTNGSGKYGYYWEPISQVVTYTTNRTETLPLSADTKFTVLVTDTVSGCVGMDEVKVTVRDDIDDLITVYNGISPNGDGKNDIWYIDGIESFPSNEVMIFNRWGDKIKTLYGYDNTRVFWDATNENGKTVPDGVYYYILKIRDIKDYTGWVEVKSGR